MENYNTNQQTCEIFTKFYNNIMEFYDSLEYGEKKQFFNEINKFLNPKAEFESLRGYFCEIKRIPNKRKKELLETIGRAFILFLNKKKQMLYDKMQYCENAIPILENLTDKFHEDTRTI